MKSKNECLFNSGPHRFDPPPFRLPQWHYTDLLALEQILRDGRIRTSRWRRNGRLICTAAWTSSAKIWEPTATATSVITDSWEHAIDDLLSGEIAPIARIEVNPDGLFSWTKHLSSFGVSDGHIWHLAECGYECGAEPENWAVSPGAIPSSAWLRVEVWAGAWVPIEITVDPELRRLAALVPDSCRRGFSATESDTPTTDNTLEA